MWAQQRKRKPFILLSCVLRPGGTWLDSRLQARVRMKTEISTFDLCGSVSNVLIQFANTQALVNCVQMYTAGL